MPDSAAGWRIEPPVSVPIAERRVERRDGRRRAAAAAAGHHVEVPRVADRPERRPLVRRAHRELVHVRLAEDHGAGIAQPLGDVGVVRRDVALEDARARGALAARDGHEVLERDRQAEQRVERVERRPAPPRGRRRAARRRRPPGRGRRSRSIASQALSAWFWRSATSRWARVSSRDETSPARSRAASSWPRSRVGSVVMPAPARHASPPRIGGTTMKSPSVSFAFRRTASTGSDAPRDVLAQDVLELDRLGGRRDRRGVELGQLRVLVEDVVELALEPVELLVGQARRARKATCSTSERVSPATDG